MESNYWHQRWQLNDIKFNQDKPSESLQRYWKDLGLKADDRVFVPLCGKSIDMVWIAQQGQLVIGVELSPIACEAFFTENNLAFDLKQYGNFKIYAGDRITLFCGDIFDLTPELIGKIDAVFDRAALVALPSQLQKSYAEHITKILDSNAKMLLATLCYDQEKMSGPPFSVDENEIYQLYGAHFKITKLLDEAIAQISPHHKAKGLTEANNVVYSLIKFQK